MRAGFERIGRGVTVKQAKRQCLDKKRYASRNEARDWAARAANRRPNWQTLHPYSCSLCGGYHLSTTRAMEYKQRTKPMPSLGHEPMQPNNPTATPSRRGKRRPDESESP